MKSKQIFFFATTADIQSVIQKFENSEAVQYFLTGMFDNSLTPKLNSMSEYKSLGYVSNGDWNQIDSFLILPKEVRINVREVPQKKGGLKFAIDQMQNPQSIVIKIGGIFKEGVLIAGSIGTISENEHSIRFFKLLSTLIKKEFVKVGTFYVGKDAKQKLDHGWRLVTNEKSPKEYDLALS